MNDNGGRLVFVDVFTGACPTGASLIAGRAKAAKTMEEIDARRHDTDGTHATVHVLDVAMRAWVVQCQTFDFRLPCFHAPTAMKNGQPTAHHCAIIQCGHTY